MFWKVRDAPRFPHREPVKRREDRIRIAFSRWVFQEKHRDEQLFTCAGGLARNQRERAARKVDVAPTEGKAVPQP
jgi:hypothetical protein